MTDDTTVDVPTGTVPEPTVTPPPEPPHPEPAPPVTPAPAPDPNLDAFARMDAEHVGQIAGARKALLASSLTQAVETKPEHQTQVVTLADKLHLPADVVEKRYDELSRQVQLQSIDYSRVMLHHPEVASWLTVPENAKIAHDDVPALTALSGALKVASGQVAAEDVTGLLPPGYVFQRDGSIRGPLRDGQATMYPSLEALQGTFARQATAQWIVQSRYEQEHGAGFLASVGAGARQSVASTLAALAAMGGGDTHDRRAVLRQSEADLGEAARLDPGFAGGTARVLGQLATDAPLYAFGGELAGLGRVGKLLGDSAIGAGAEGYRARVAVEDALGAWERSGDKRQVERLLQSGLAPTQPAAAQRLATSARLLAQGADLAPDPLSLYSVDAFKTAVAYAPAAARSGINQGAEHGTGYGITDFLINDLLPATGGSKLGLAKAIIPGEETAAAGGGFAGLAGRLLLHSGAQAGLMGATELGNAIHEYTTGVNPDALSWDQLAPRLAQAGALGGLMAGAFHLAPEIGHLTYRRKIAANAALTDADHLGYAVEQAIGSKAVERVPARAEQMMQAVTASGPARTRYLQGDDFLEVAKAAKITPEELASKLQIETQWEEAKRLGKTMSLSLDQLTARLAEMHEQPEAIKAAIDRVRSQPDGWNRADGLHFYQASPTEIDKQLEAMRADVGKAARDMSEADPIYQDYLGKLVDAGEDPQVAQDNARLTAALFNHRVARFNRGAAERGATLLDPLAEYQKYQLQVRRGELGDATAGTRLEQPAYHGSPHEFDKFTTEKIGTGEGAQAYGWGLYFSSRKGVAKHYKDTLGNKVTYKGKQIDIVDEALDPEHAAAMSVAQFMRSGQSFETAVRHARTDAYRGVRGFRESGTPSDHRIADGYEASIRALDAMKPEDLKVSSGRLYHVDVPEDKEMLNQNEPIVSQGEVAKKVMLLSDKYPQSIGRGDIAGAFIREDGSLSPTVDGHKLYDSFLYENEEAGLSPDKAAEKVSRDLLSVGIPGMIFHGGTSAKNYVVFDDSRIAITKFEQPSGSKNAPRGAIEFGPERHFLMTLTSRANLSTVLHESSHFWLEVMGDFAERPDAPQEFKDDYAKALAFLGAKDRASIGVEHHEKWARAVEQYLMEGHAPSPELRPVFQRFLVWLTDLYRSVKRLVKLTPEVTGVFDRLLASDEAIREAQTELNTSTLYPTREHWGGNDESWQAYQAAIGRARDSAQANVFSQAMAVLRRQKSKTWKEEYAGAVGEAEALIRARPIRIAEEALVKGRGRDGKDLAQPVKLDRLEIRDTYGPEALARIPRGATGIADPGSTTRVLSLAQAAELFEISSGKDLLDQLSSLPKRMAEVHELAKGMMEARHPDLTPEAMRQAAMDAVHANDAHADVLNREAASLAVKADRQHIPREQIRQLAERIVGETQIDSINPKLHLREQMTASKDATEALLKPTPDYTAALLAKQREQLAHELYRAAAAAAERIDKCDTLMRDSRKKKAQEMLGRADAHTGGTGWYVDGGDGMPLPAMDQKTAEAIAEETGGEAKQGQTYRDAMNALSSFWLDDKAKRLDLRMAQVDSLYRQAQATMFRARDAFSIRKGEEQANLDELVAAGMTAANTDKAGNAKPPLRPGRRDRGPFDWFTAGASRGFAFLRDMPHVVRLMDNDTSGGWFWEHIARPLNHAADDEQRRQFENAQLLSEAYRDYQQTEGKSRLMAHDTFIPAIGRSLNLEARLSVLANAGSTKNLRRLMDGEGWSRQQITAIIATLDKADIGFVKRLWLLANKDWESTKETHRRLFGVTPEKRDSLLVETAHGTIEGAYYPIHYDQDRTARRQDISLEREKEALRSMPNAGFTMQTVERTNRPLLLTMDVIPRHLNTVAHWLSHVEPIDSLNKLLGDERLWSTMVERFGKDEADVVRDTVREVARGQRGPRNWLEKSIRFLRTRSGMATMGFNVMSAASQPFGLTQSMERVGVGAYIHAQARVMQGHESMESWGAFVRSKSGMMARRGENLIIETAERQGRSAVGGVTGWLQDHSYTLMNKAQWLVDLPTWVAEYEKMQKVHPDDDRRCVDLADQAVLDTQGSGLAKDISAAQRNEIGKLLMQFGGFFNKTYNEAYNRLATNAHLAGGWAPLPNDVESLGRLAGSYLLLVGLPSVAMSIFKQAVRPDPKDDGSASWWAKRLAKDQAGYLLSTVIFGRELSGALDGFDYNGPAGMRSVALSSQLLKQVMSVDVTTGAGINARLGKAAALTAASLTGLPGNQAWRTLSGLMHDIENRSANPLPLLFGPPPAH